MLRIVSHIERLLAYHDCVIMPKLGGFVLQNRPATYNKKEHRLAPMCTEIVFNSSLTHSDGLLATSYAEYYKIDYTKAQQMVASDVEELNILLNKFGKAELGEIGSFSLDKERHIHFHPGNSLAVSAGQYGLSSFYVPVLPSAVRNEAKDKPTRKAEMYYVPISHKFVQIVVTSAAAIGVFLLFSTPIKDVSLSAYKAGFVPTEKIVPPDQSLKPALLENNVIIDTDIITIAPVSETKNSITEETPVVSASNTLPLKMYYIVIGSFPNEQLANKYIAEVYSDDFANANTVVRDEKYRVYAKAFDNRTDAESYLTDLRKNEKYQNAWLFISR